jgi:hypothetical protein
MKAEVVWAKTLWEVFEELPQKGKLPRLWNAWISSDTSLTHTPCARAAGFAAIVFFQAGNWLVFYKIVEDTIYIRGL